MMKKKIIETEDVESGNQSRSSRLAGKPNKFRSRFVLTVVERLVDIVIYENSVLYVTILRRRNGAKNITQ